MKYLFLLYFVYLAFNFTFSDIESVISTLLIYFYKLPTYHLKVYKIFCQLRTFGVLSTGKLKFPLVHGHFYLLF